jgi:hypothetical protein
LDFDNELDEIIGMHRYLVRTARHEHEAEYEHQLEIHDPENYDGGDAIWDAEKVIGVDSYAVESHAGLMAIARAVSISEVTLARMAAHHVKNADIWVFPNGGLWTRDWEAKYYKHVLIAAFNVGGNGFTATRELRDLYTHGYGVPATQPRLDKLAQRLHDSFATTPATDTEKALGYVGDAYFFGSGTTYPKKTRTLESEWGFSSHRADVSELATYRVLEQLRVHIHAAHAAFQSGMRDDIDDATNPFVKTVNAWWDKRTSGTAATMPNSDTASMSVAELVALSISATDELKSRGYARTGASLAGELMERVVADAYEGTLAPPVTASYDVTASDGRTIQVKVRSLPRGDTRFWSFKDSAFDAAVVISLDRADLSIIFARELTSAEVDELSVAHTKGGFRVRMGRARTAGIDVTEKLQSAYEALK